MTADVYAAGELVARVTRQPDSTTFTYSEGYDGPALVPHLPSDTTTWPAGSLPPLLSNLLPEGRRLEALRQQVKTSGQRGCAADHPASYLLGNGDLHATNLSVLDRGAGLEPSPVYDVTFTHPYGDTDTMALLLCGESRVAKIRRTEFAEAADRCGVRAAGLERVINRLLARTRDVPEQLSAGWPQAGDTYRRVLEQRRHQLSR